MRKIYFDVKVKLIVEVDEGFAPEDIIQEVELDVVTPADWIEIVCSEIMDYEITDSK